MGTYEPVGQLKFQKLTHNKDMYLAYRIVDVDQQTGAAANGQIDQNDLLTAIPVPAGETVLSAWVEVMTACTGAASCDVGVGENVAHWVNGAPLDGALIDANGTAVEGWPHRFSANDTIDVTVLEAAITAGVFKVCALILRTSN
jgi:hypothetical protein